MVTWRDYFQFGNTAIKKILTFIARKLRMKPKLKVNFCISGCTHRKALTCPFFLCGDSANNCTTCHPEKINKLNKLYIKYCDVYTVLYIYKICRQLIFLVFLLLNTRWRCCTLITQKQLCYGLFPVGLTL